MQYLKYRYCFKNHFIFQNQNNSYDFKSHFLQQNTIFSQIIKQKNQQKFLNNIIIQDNFLILHNLLYIVPQNKKKQNIKKKIIINYMKLFGKKDKPKEPVISQEDQKSLQYEKQIHNLNTQIGNLDDQLEKVDAKVLKLDEDIKALVSQKKIPQAKAKISEMKTYQKQIEAFENKKSVLTQMKIQMESMSIDSKLVGALQDGTKLLQSEDIAGKLEDVMMDVQEIFQQQSQTNDLFSQMANQNVDQSELDEELSKYVTQADTLQAQQAQQQFNQVPVLPVQQNKPQVQVQQQKQVQQQPQLAAFLE
ncbi:hypothetical protein pb186bvf_003775 [Paramecium bursaria]